MNQVPAPPPHPRRVHGPGAGDGREAREREVRELRGTREGDGGAGPQQLEHVDDGVLDARERRPLVGRHQRLRQLLRRQVEDPDPEPREREEREQR